MELKQNDKPEYGCLLRRNFDFFPAGFTPNYNYRIIAIHIYKMICKIVGALKNEYLSSKHSFASSEIQTVIHIRAYFSQIHDYVEKAASAFTVKMHRYNFTNFNVHG
ncbi:Hypothetical predicted protein [Octopus vulgaris]|uniref:Uncharacterized protein n=1 Tax=Octopus vulgaris TaxID=6645 RepID=A0AA36AZ03_OCTVU|nr:Hypothetical predicted protein [Octopus vulgaris]